MLLRIPKPVVERLGADLARAAHREIGGILFGEQLAEGDFRIVAVSSQTGGGTRASFRRNGSKAQKQTRFLHQKFGDDPRRFNYLGEWHSHPNAPAVPSLRDEQTMWQLLDGQGNAVNFLVLIIVRLAGQQKMEIGAQVYLKSGQKLDCSVVQEDAAEPNTEDAE